MSEKENQKMFPHQCSEWINVIESNTELYLLPPVLKNFANFQPVMDNNGQKQANIIKAKAN